MVGLIGIGLLGTALAERFLKAGFQVLGFDVSAERRAALGSLGGTAAGSAAEVASVCGRTVLCLPDSGVTAAVLEEVETALAPGALIIDVTTGAPEEMESFGQRLAKRGVVYLDATVAGSSNQVRRGEAIVMVGGGANVCEGNRDLFSSFSKNVFHVGKCGAGARMKLVVNLVLGLNRAALAEALSFAACCGIDPAQALEVLMAGPAYSRVMDIKGTRMVERNYQPEARLRQHHKDVRLILSEAARTGSQAPLSALHDRLLDQAESAGWGDADNSAIIEVFRDKGILCG